MTKIENPALTVQGTSKKIFKAVINRYFIIYHAIVKPDLQKQLENLNIVLFEKRRDAGFMEGGR